MEPRPDECAVVLTSEARRGDGCVTVACRCESNGIVRAAPGRRVALAISAVLLLGLGLLGLLSIGLLIIGAGVLAFASVRGRRVTIRPPAR